MCTKAQTHNHAKVKSMHNQFNQIMFRNNSYKSRVILSLIIIKHFMIKNNNQLNNTQTTYIGLELKSS